MAPVYDHANPWTEFIRVLRTVTGEDPLASFSNIMRDDFSQINLLIRHAELTTAAHLFLSRRNAYGSVNTSGRIANDTSKETLCFYHKEFGKKTVKCRRYSKCLALVSSVQEYRIR